MKMSCLFIIFYICSGSTDVMAQANSAGCKFVGNLILKPVWDDPVLGNSGPHDVGDYEMQLQEDLTYIECSLQSYTVKAGAVVNGASIPQGAWTVLGYTPWSGPTQKPAAVHDDMCGRVVLTSKRVHNIFHEALISSGASAWKAAVIYAAVSNFGPQWSRPGGPVTYPTYSEAMLNLIIRLLGRGERVLRERETIQVTPQAQVENEYYSIRPGRTELNGTEEDRVIVDRISQEALSVPLEYVPTLLESNRVQIK